MNEQREKCIKDLIGVDDELWKILDSLMSAVKKADKEYDGHLTIFKGTTGWKVAFASPEIPYDDHGEFLLHSFPAGMTFKEAIDFAIKENKNFWKT